jgi:hypothetical protein
MTGAGRSTAQAAIRASRFLITNRVWRATRTRRS